MATASHPRGMNALVPVLKQLVADENLEVLIFGQQFTVAALQTVGLPFMPLSEMGLPDVSCQSMEVLLAAAAPDLILLGTAAQQETEELIEHSLVQAGRKAKIPTLSVLDFWAGYVRRFTDQRTGQELDCLPDKIAVMDSIAKHEMLDLGFPPEKLVVTGNPHYDNLAQKGQNFSCQDRQKIREKIGFLPGTVFFFAGNVFEIEKEQYGYWDLDIINLIIHALPMLPNVYIAIKLHPRMPVQDIQKISKAIAPVTDRVKLVTNIDSQTLALAADLTIVGFSTVGIEAVYMGRPCVSLQPGLQGKDQLIISRKKVISAGYVPEGCKAILNLAQYPQYRYLIVEKTTEFTTDGKATSRVAELIYSMIPD